MTNVSGVNVQAVTRTLIGGWSERVGSWLATMYPGRIAESSEWGEWNEVWVSTWRDPVQRERGKHRVRVEMTAHVFVRRGENAGRGGEIVERIRKETSGLCLAVHEGEGSEDRIAGYVRLFEPEVRNLSRPERERSGSGLEHLVMQWYGVAEETG